jgi:hypothetical protein
MRSADVVAALSVRSNFSLFHATSFIAVCRLNAAEENMTRVVVLTGGLALQGFRTDHNVIRWVWSGTAMSRRGESEGGYTRGAFNAEPMA